MEEEELPKPHVFDLNKLESELDIVELFELHPPEPNLIYNQTQNLFDFISKIKQVVKVLTLNNFASYSIIFTYDNLTANWLCKKECWSRTKYSPLVELQFYLELTFVLRF